MDAETAKKIRARIKRIEGQAAGIRRMLDEDRYCIDILHQITAARGALTEAGKIILASHVKTCVLHALERGTKRERQRKIDELVDLFER